MKKYISVLFLLVFIIPSVAFASWWNPISWFNNWSFKKIEITSPSPIDIQKNSDEKINELQKEINLLKNQQINKESKNSTPKKEISETSTKVKAETPSGKTEVIIPVVKNYREQVLLAISTQIESYKKITSWIDSDMMPLLSQRENALNGLISSTNSLMINETDSSIDNAYSIFIEAYNLDKSQVVDFYQGIFSDIKNHINNEKISALNSEYEKFSAKSSVSEVEYNNEIQVLIEYKNYWQKLYDSSVKLAMTQYMSQTNTKDEMYQRLWLKLSISVSDLKKTQALQSSLSQLYSQQVKPINCSFNSRSDEFGTNGSITCF